MSTSKSSKQIAQDLERLEKRNESIVKQYEDCIFQRTRLQDQLKSAQDREKQLEKKKAAAAAKSTKVPPKPAAASAKVKVTTTKKYEPTGFLERMAYGIPPKGGRKPVVRKVVQVPVNSGKTNSGIVKPAAASKPKRSPKVPASHPATARSAPKRSNVAKTVSAAPSTPRTTQTTQTPPKVSLKRKASEPIEDVSEADRVVSTPRPLKSEGLPSTSASHASDAKRRKVSKADNPAMTTKKPAEQMKPEAVLEKQHDENAEENDDDDLPEKVESNWRARRPSMAPPKSQAKAVRKSRAASELRNSAEPGSSPSDTVANSSPGGSQQSKARGPVGLVDLGDAGDSTSDTEEGDNSLGEKQKQTSKRQGEPSGPRPQPHGSTNWGLSCYGNATDQVYRKALSDEMVQSLKSNDAPLNKFGLDTDACLEYDNSAQHKQQKRRELESKLTRLREDIKAASQTGTLSTAAYFGRRLQELSNGVRDQSERLGNADNYVPGLLSHQVFAYSALENETSREMFNGEAQEDCHEYFEARLNTLIAELDATQADGLRESFEIRTQVQDKCSTPGCNHEHEPREVTGMSHHIFVETPAGERCTLEGQLQRSLTSEVDRPCTGCKKHSLVSEASFQQLPENLVIKVNRFKNDGVTSGFTKDERELVLNFDDIAVGDEKYQVTAVVQHCGPNLEFGHYTATVREGNAWSRIDDKDVRAVETKDVRDGGRRGRFAMLLLQKVQR